VDASSARMGGGFSYVASQLPALERCGKGLRFEVLTSRDNSRQLSDLLSSRVRVLAFSGPALRVAYQNLSLPLWSRKVADVIYCPGNFCPLLPTGVPIVLTQQNARYFGEGRSYLGRWPSRGQVEAYLSYLSIRRATAVVVVSNSLLRLIRQQGFAPEKLHLIHSGRPSWPGSSERPPGLREIGDYFLTVSHDYPHKRLDDVILAWARAFHGESGPALVVAGRVSRVRRTRMLSSLRVALQRDIVFLGDVRDRRQIRWLMENATALVSSSAVEAFPLTPVEAASVGCPAIVSDIAAHREVTGGSGSFFPPGDRNALAGLLREALHHQSDRIPVVWEKTWDSNAQELAALLRRVAMSAGDARK
jgi:glycosyltransferase involved in cell wall biosynthesis